MLSPQEFAIGKMATAPQMVLRHYREWCESREGEFTSEDVAKALGVSRQVASTRLTYLAKRGVIVKVREEWRSVTWRRA